MHAMVLGFAGYGLLISSFVALILLLRMGGLKDILKSPLHMLSTSDTLISIITSIILLVNQSVSSTNFDQTLPIARGNQIENQQLLQDRGNEDLFQNQTCMRFYRKINGSGLDSSETVASCTFQHVLIHYAMFLVPFANAFMSLLIYSVQCSTGMSCVNKKCLGLTRVTLSEAEALNLNNRERNSEAQGDLNIISKDPQVSENTKETNLTISNDESDSTNVKNNPKFTGFGLITQWLVPILVTAILYLSKTQDMKKLHERNEMECIFKINFPLESCFKSKSMSTDLLRNGNRNFSQLFLEADVPDTSKISYPDSQAINEVVSKVQKVVQSAMNKNCDNNSGKLNYYDSLKPWNITNYITANNLTQAIASDKNDVLEKLSDLQNILNNKNLEMTGNKGCETTEDDELKLFEDVVESTRSKNTSESMPTTEETVPEDLLAQQTWTEVTISRIIDKMDEIPVRNESDMSLNNTSDKNKTVMMKTTEDITGKLNDQIYAGIIKKIRDTVIQVKANKENLRNSEDQVLLRKSKNSFFNENKDESVSQLSFETTVGCFLSTKFLKIHLLILLFLIYFIPVLISVILQTRAVYMCKIVIEKIETVNRNQDSKPSQIVNPSDSIIDESQPSKSGWFSAKPIAPQSLGDHDPEMEERKTLFKNVLNETKNLQLLFNILSKSLILGILMWTPAFLEILSKVFLCASTPSWLVNTLYLLGVSFGIVKNFFNVSIAKINKNINDQIYKKENSIHPNV